MKGLGTGLNNWRRIFPWLVATLLTHLAMTQQNDVLHTPQDRFGTLAEYPFAPHYVSITPSLRMHYLDEGRADAPVVLLVHGEPTWSFYYRRMIPSLVEQGYRVVVPDLIGFGKSDKPTAATMHTYARHTAWLTTFMEQLGLTDVCLYGHDWGGMIALRIVADQPAWFAGVVVSYAFLFTGEESVPNSFRDWQHFSQTDPAFRAGTVVNLGSYTELPDAVRAAYDAPFPDETYKAGIRRFPMLIPTDPDDPEAQTNARLREKLKTFDKPFLTVWGDHADAMWQGKDTVLQAEVPRAQGQPHRVLSAGHFLQEDQPEVITEIIINFLTRR